MLIRQFYTHLLLLILSPFFISQAEATVQPARNLDQMIRATTQIIQGKVFAKRFVWGSQKKYIYTEIKLRVISYLKGQGNPTFTFHKIGGQMEQIASHVPGTANYRVGEEVVIFVEPKRHKVLRFVLGMAAGKYQVYRKNGRVLLHRSTQGLAFHKIPGGNPQSSNVSDAKHSESPLPLETLKKRILKNQNAPKQLRILAPALTPLQQKYLRLMRLQKAKQNCLPSRQKLRAKQPFGTLFSKSPHKNRQVKHPMMGKLLRPLSTKKVK